MRASTGTATALISLSGINGKQKTSKHNMSKTPMIIGLGYRARSGKDTVADHLMRSYGFSRVAFADKLKAAVAVITGADPAHPDFKTDLIKFGLTGGQILQRVGVACREAIPGLWIEAAEVREKYIMLKRIVIPDVRFEDEAALIRELGGELWEVRRSVAIDDHVSESTGTKIKWDRVIENYGSHADLYDRVNAAYTDALRKREGLRGPASAGCTPCTGLPSPDLRSRPDSYQAQ